MDYRFKFRMCPYILYYKQIFYHYTLHVFGLNCNQLTNWTKCPPSTDCSERDLDLIKGLRLYISPFVGG